MYVVTRKPTFEHELQFTVPDGEKRTPASVNLTFKYLTKPEVAALLERGLSNEALVREVITNVGNVGGPDGQPLGFPASLEAVLTVHGMDELMASAFLYANRAAPGKNS